MPSRENNKRKVKPPKRFESGTATEDNKKRRLKEAAEKGPKFTKVRRKTPKKYETIISLAKWLLEAQVGTTGNYHGKDLKVIGVNKEFVKCVVKNETTEGRSHVLLRQTKTFPIPVSPLPSEATIGSWYLVLWSGNYYRCQVAKIISNNEWLIKFEGVGRQYKYEHSGVFSTRVKPIRASPKIANESEEGNEEAKGQEPSSESANNLSVEEDNEESITRYSTPAGKNSVSINTGIQTQATNLNADCETTILNGMTIVSSSSSATLGQSASSTATTGGTATPNTIRKRAERSNNEIHHHKFLKKNAALSLLSKEIMEFKFLFDNNAISEATYKTWVANAKNTYDAVSAINER